MRIAVDALCYLRDNNWDLTKATEMWIKIENQPLEIRICISFFRNNYLWQLSHSSRSLFDFCLGNYFFLLLLLHYPAHLISLVTWQRLRTSSSGDKVQVQCTQSHSAAMTHFPPAACGRATQHNRPYVRPLLFSIPCRAKLRWAEKLMLCVCVFLRGICSPSSAFLTLHNYPVRMQHSCSNLRCQSTTHSENQECLMNIHQEVADTHTHESPTLWWGGSRRNLPLGLPLTPAGINSRAEAPWLWI